jgi:hypothetical protein
LGLPLEFILASVVLSSQSGNIIGQGGKQHSQKILPLSLLWL